MSTPCSPRRQPRVRKCAVELGIGPRDIVVGTVANLRRTKGYPDLLEAAQIVVAECPNVRFVAVGQGPLEAEFARTPRRTGLGDRFLFTGYRADAVRVMSAFDLFCLASHHEGLPIAMLEALTLGLPVVATDVGGINEVFGETKDALLVPPSEPELLAKALIALATDPDRRHAMTRAAVARRPDFAVDGAVREMERMYAEALAR